MAAVYTPTFNVPGGTYSTVQVVTISDPWTGSTIYYTTDGSTPSANSPVYTGAITVSSTTTINALAIAPYATPPPHSGSDSCVIVSVVQVVQFRAGVKYLSDCNTAPYLRFFLVRNEEAEGSNPFSSTKISKPNNKLASYPAVLDAKRIASLRAQGVGWKAIATEMGAGVGTVIRHGK